MLIPEVIILFFGMCIGSFINVLLFRLDRRKGIVAGRSECPYCAHRLAWYDLIPVVSYIILRGRCRYCRRKISVRYPVVELSTGICFLLFSIYNLSAVISLTAPIYGLFLISVFIALLYFDLTYYILPDKIIFPSLAVALVYNLIFNAPQLLNLFITALVLSGIFAIVYLVTRGRGMGFGDVKLMLLIGLVFGFPSGAIVTVAAIWLATIVGAVLLLFRKAGLKTALPLGTFLSITAILFIIFSQHLPQFLKDEIFSLSHIF